MLHSFNNVINSSKSSNLGQNMFNVIHDCNLFYYVKEMQHEIKHLTPKVTDLLIDCQDAHQSHQLSLIRWLLKEQIGTNRPKGLCHQLKFRKNSVLPWRRTFGWPQETSGKLSCESGRAWLWVGRRTAHLDWEYHQNIGVKSTLKRP